MIRVSVLYPNTDGNTFDHDYFLGTHMPLVADRCGDGLRKWEVDKGIAGGEADAPPATTRAAFSLTGWGKLKKLIAFRL